MPLSRRHLLGSSAVAGAGILTASAGASVLGAPTARAAAASRPGGARALFPALGSSAGDLLALPPGFTYETVAVSGVTDLHDGAGTVIGKTPERPDGTTVVERGNRLRLIQNHEAGPGSSLPVPFVDGTVYDRGALGGGCTVLETSRTTGKRISEWVGLSGTISNCAGGPTPWGSWLTCEESEDKAGKGTLE
jgi:uncharacterized protein